MNPFPFIWIERDSSSQPNLGNCNNRTLNKMSIPIHNWIEGTTSELWIRWAFKFASTKNLSERRKPGCLSKLLIRYPEHKLPRPKPCPRRKESLPKGSQPFNPHRLHKTMERVPILNLSFIANRLIHHPRLNYISWTTQSSRRKTRHDRGQSVCIYVVTGDLILDN